MEAEPHVIIRAKRLFERARKGEAGEVLLSDSIEICRELEWFLGRFPLEMAKLDRMHLEGSSKKHQERQSLVEQMLAGQLKPQAFELALPAREYQRVAADLWLRTGGLLLADDVGLGKTCSAIAALTDPRTRPALVVTLTHLTKQWQQELARFAPKLTTHVLKTRSPYDVAAQGHLKGTLPPEQATLPGMFPDVIITSYSKLSGWGETLAPLVKSVVYDEVQELRRGAYSDKGTAAGLISGAAAFKIGLSATPIYNYGEEIYSVLEFISPPDTLGTRAEFMREWCGASRNIDDPQAFGRYLREQGLMIRRTREEVGRELPELVRISHDIETDDKPLRDINSAAEKLAGIILAQRETQKGEKMQASEELSNIVRHATGVAKAPYVAEFVRMLVENGEKVVVFGWHRDVYAIWQERLWEYQPALYTGSESFRQKDESRRRFISGETPILLMSLRSGAGLDGLQGACHTVVFGELDWSPGVHEQCIGRIYRDGQGRAVVVYYLLADQGSDPIVADVLGVKRAQVEGLRNPSEDLIEKLDTSGDRVRALAQQYLAKPRSRSGAAIHSFTEAKAKQPEATT